MLIERQAKDIINQHIDILIKLKEELSLIKHEGFKGEKTLENRVKYDLGFIPKVPPKVAH